MNTGVGIDRQRHVLNVVAEPPEGEGLRAALRDACLESATRTRATSTTVYLATGRGTVRPFETSCPRGEEIAELQTVLEEGPSCVAARESWPVFVPHLADSANARRWPLFAPAAVAAGVAAVFAVPLTFGTSTLGAVEIHRDVSDPLRSRELAAISLLADVVTTLLLEPVGGSDDYNDREVS